MLFRLMTVQQQPLSLGAVTTYPLLTKIPSVSAQEFARMVPWASCYTSKCLALKTAFRWAALLYKLGSAGPAGNSWKALYVLFSQAELLDQRHL